jgi:hypothetical protein
LHDADRARKAAEESKAAQARDRVPVEAALCPTGIVFGNSLLQELNQHAIDVAVRYGITVEADERGECGWANWEKREISVSAGTSEITYAILLHEVAHIVDPEADSSSTIRSLNTRWSAPDYLAESRTWRVGVGRQRTRSTLRARCWSGCVRASADTHWTPRRAPPSGQKRLKCRNQGINELVSSDHHLGVVGTEGCWLATVADPAPRERPRRCWNWNAELMSIGPAVSLHAARGTI